MAVDAADSDSESSDLGDFESMPVVGSTEGFAEVKPNPMRVVKGVLGQVMQPGRGSRVAYATVGQDDEDYLDGDVELEKIGGLLAKAIDPEAEQEGKLASASAGEVGEEYWAMQRAGNCATFFNLCNTSLGIGILSFSLAFAMGGVLSTLVFTICAGVVSCISSLIIVMSCAHYRQVSFQGLVRAALGPGFEFAVSITLIVLCFGTCAGYLNVIGNYASAVVHQWSTVPDTAPECLFPSQWWCAREFLMPVFGTAVVLPLSLMPTLESLANASFLGICSIGLMASSVCYRGLATYSVGGMARTGFDGGPVLLTTSVFPLLRTTGIVIFAFSAQAQVPNLFAELAPPPSATNAEKQLRETARVGRMKRLLVAGSLTMVAFCVACGLGGYMHFGDRVESNVLEPFPLDDQLITVARVAMVLVASVSHPVIHFT